MKRYIRCSDSRRSDEFNEAQFDNLHPEYKEFNSFKKWVIDQGLKSGVDVTVYADPKYDFSQMNEIRKGLEAGLDASVYADPKYTGAQMYELREGLESGVDIKRYANPNYHPDKMGKIRKRLEQGDLPSSSRSSVPIPAGLSKYYKKATKSDLAEIGSARDIAAFKSDMKAICEGYGATLLGFAVARDKYYDILSDAGVEFAIVVDMDGDTKLVYNVGHDLYNVEDEIDTLE